VNDDIKKVEPVDLSPTRAELIARVRARGRQIRARRRLGIAGIAALVVVAIAAPAIAIGSRSTSSSAPIATNSAGFQIVGIRASVARPVSHFGKTGCPRGTTPSPSELECLTLSRGYAGTRWVVSVAVQPRGHSWTVAVDLREGLAIDVARFHLRHGWALVVDGRVVGIIITPAPLGTGALQTRFVVAQNVSRSQAIEIGTRIWARAPRILPTPPTLSSHFELTRNVVLAGAPLRGTLVVDNNTDQAVTLERPGQCGGKWAVALTNAGVPADVAFTSDCSSHRTILAAGETRFPFNLSTIYRGCSNSTSPLPAGLVHCLPGGGIPPLPPGPYQAVVVDTFQGSFPTPPRVTVQIVPK
jgi:hypothetical protein